MSLVILVIPSRGHLFSLFGSRLPVSSTNLTMDIGRLVNDVLYIILRCFTEILPKTHVSPTQGLGFRVYGFMGLGFRACSSCRAMRPPPMECPGPRSHPPLPKLPPFMGLGWFRVIYLPLVVFQNGGKGNVLVLRACFFANNPSRCACFPWPSPSHLPKAKAVL